jgi:hypothetical protein
LYTSAIFKMTTNQDILFKVWQCFPETLKTSDEEKHRFQPDR